MPGDIERDLLSINVDSGYHTIGCICSFATSRDGEMREEAKRLYRNMQESENTRLKELCFRRFEESTGKSGDPKQYLERIAEAYKLAPPEMAEKLSEIAADAKETERLLGVFIG